MLAHPAVLGARVLPRSRIVAVASIIGFAFLTAVLAQWEIPLGVTPVPITGQTLGVVLAGAALDWILGAAGLPFYAGGGSGWETATGSTAGYLVGFIVAAWLVGKLAESRQDRKVLTAIPAILAGSVVIYGFGVSWLMYSLDVNLAQGLEWGFTPFVVGDLIKVAAAGTVLPGVWKLLGDKS